MTIRQVKTGWQVDIQPGGRGGKRIKKTFEKKADALAWERHIRAKVTVMPDWLPAKKDTRPLSELCELWFRLHGIGLQSSKDTFNRLTAMCVAMGNPIAESFSADIFAEYRTKRIEQGISHSNMNRELAYLRAMFNELIRLKQWSKENPLKHLRPFKVQETELSYLEKDQLKLLFAELSKSRNVHVSMVAKVCLATGARWSESEQLRSSQLKGDIIQYVKTKSSKARSVPITSSLSKELREHHKAHSIGEQFFSYAASAFREAIERSQIKLPDGQLTHVLRHTFASHFMINGGNILTLQKILGHHNLTMTMRYAHLSPGALSEATRLNPLVSPGIG